MLEGPSDEARVAIAREVLSCAHEDVSATNGKMYYDHYIRACKLVLFSAILKDIQQSKRLTAVPQPRPTTLRGPLLIRARR
jgi:hypothetical protein